MRSASSTATSGNNTADDTPASEVVDHLRDTQAKLANEQARYQIAFRQDLAELANLLKHT